MPVDKPFKRTASHIMIFTEDMHSEFFSASVVAVADSIEQAKDLLRIYILSFARIRANGHTWYHSISANTDLYVTSEADIATLERTRNSIEIPFSLSAEDSKCNSKTKCTRSIEKQTLVLRESIDVSERPARLLLVGEYSG